MLWGTCSAVQFSPVTCVFAFFQLAERLQTQQRQCMLCSHSQQAALPADSNSSTAAGPGAGGDQRHWQVHRPQNFEWQAQTKSWQI